MTKVELKEFTYNELKGEPTFVAKFVKEYADMIGKGKDFLFNVTKCFQKAGSDYGWVIATTGDTDGVMINVKELYKVAKDLFQTKGTGKNMKIQLKDETFTLHLTPNGIASAK